MPSQIQSWKITDIQDYLYYKSLDLTTMSLTVLTVHIHQESGEKCH